MSQTAINTIRTLFEQHGRQNYGEDVTQLDHAVQAATRGREYGQSEAVILAAFLHDIGHLMQHEGLQTMGDYGVMAHDKLGSDYLRSLGFGEDVTSLVQQHVPAKRYLCATRTDYYAQLSEASKITFGYQGGPMNAEEVAEFAQLPNLAEVLTVRRLDEEAKDNGWSLDDVEWIWEMMARHLAT